MERPGNGVGEGADGVGRIARVPDAAEGVRWTAGVVGRGAGVDGARARIVRVGAVIRCARVQGVDGVVRSAAGVGGGGGLTPSSAARVFRALAQRASEAVRVASVLERALLAFRTPLVASSQG